MNSKANIKNIKNRSPKIRPKIKTIMNSYKNHTLKPPASDSAKEYYSLVNSPAPKKRLNKFNYVLYDSKGNNMSANRSTNRESSLKNSASDLNFTNSQLFPSVENISDKLESLK